ncbi:MAG TPA: hypothetical protein VKR32_13310, partial [Puia sp.]|nr:hypothetical protein [Puia sp.]
PLVYCIEGADNNSKAWNVLLPDHTSFQTDFERNILNGVIVITAELPVLMVGPDKQSINTQTRIVKAIPYYSWCNRGPDDMQVWIPRNISDVKINF